MLDLAANIIETKPGTFDLSGYEDRYETALIDLIKTSRAVVRFNRLWCHSRPMSSI